MARLSTFQVPEMAVVDNDMFNNGCGECTGNQIYSICTCGSSHDNKRPHYT